MNKVNEFFDWDKFTKGKEYQVVSITPWKDFKDKSIVYGSNVVCIITKDETTYSKPDITNRFEKIFFKIPAKMEIISKYIKLDMVVVPTDVVAKVTAQSSGTFMNYNLSVECKGFLTSDGKKII